MFFTKDHIPILMSFVAAAKLQLVQCLSSLGEWRMEERMAMMFADQGVMIVVCMLMIAELSLLESDQTLTTHNTNFITAPMQDDPSHSSFHLPSQSPPYYSDNSTHDLLHLTPTAHLHPSTIHQLSLTRHVSYPSHHPAPSPF